MNLKDYDNSTFKTNSPYILDTARDASSALWKCFKSGSELFYPIEIFFGFFCSGLRFNIGK